MIGKLITFFAIGLVTILVAGVVLAVLGVAFSIALGLGTFLLFKVAPILLLGWIVVKLYERASGKKAFPASDRGPLGDSR